MDEGELDFEPNSLIDQIANEDYTDKEEEDDDEIVERPPSRPVTVEQLPSPYIPVTVE